MFDYILKTNNSTKTRAEQLFFMKMQHYGYIHFFQQKTKVYLYGILKSCQNKRKYWHNSVINQWLFPYVAAVAD